MSINSRGALLGAAANLATAAIAQAQVWTPDRSVRIIVLFNVGDIIDVRSRGMATGLG